MKAPIQIAVAFCAFAHMHADDEPLLLRSNTQLVQVNVVVHNKKGEPVSDLTKDDFSLSERGKPQTISFFSVESTAKPASPPVQLPPHIFSDSFEGRSGAPGSVTVILLDSLNTEWKDQVFAQDQLVRFLQQIRPEDRVALYTLGRGLKILHDYTTDSAQLVARLGKFHGQELPDAAASQADSGQQQKGFDFLANTQPEAEFNTNNRVLNTLQALEAIARHLASVPGRKNLIWLSGGFPLQMGFDQPPGGRSPPKEQRSFVPEMNHAIRALNNANVAMYPVDARGLVVGNGVTGATSSAPRRRGAFEPTVSNLETMNELASRTGGQAYYNGNALDKAIRNAMEDAKVTYTLGYYPAAGEEDDKFREIKVKVNRAGVTARYRNGYFPARELQQDVSSRKAQLASAAWSPLDATAVTLFARIDIVNEPVAGTIRVVAQVDASTLHLEQKADKWVGIVDLIFVQKDEQGRQLAGGITDSVSLNLPRDSYQKILEKGLIYQRSFQKQANAASIRIAVRDVSTGLAGSITVPFSRLTN